MNLKHLLIAAGIYLLSVGASPAQRFNSVVFNKLPQDYQLYPRNAENEATVPFSGIVEGAGWKYISIQVTRENAAYKYLRANITYQNNIGRFSAEQKIKAELAGYDFKIYVCKDGDSALVVNRQQVVSGDVYVLSGQSNSTGFFGEPDTNRFCRTFGKITQNLNTDPYNAADTLWTYSNKNSYDNGVGTMGFEIQKQLMQKSGIPNCLINAGFHWSSAWSHAQRTENNPADLTNGYGRMLYRLQKAGVASAVKAYMFRQGESEAYNEGSYWEDNFDKLRKNLKMDLAGLQKIYVFQIDIIYYPTLVGAILRDYQRRLPDIYPDVRSLATVGTSEFDGLHYGHGGNVQSGQEVSRLIERDFYGLKDTLNINSPSLKKAFYSEDRTKVILVFDEGQELVYPEPYKPNGNVTLDLKDLFYTDGFTGFVSSGKAEGNRVILTMTGPQTAKMLDYLPNFLEQGGPYYPFTGPYIKNKLGMRAFTFYQVPIAAGMKTPTLTAAAKEDKSISLNWESVTGATEYKLERKLPGANSYVALETLSSSVLTFTDKPGLDAGAIEYRLKAVSKTSESADYAYAKYEFPVITGVEQEADAPFSVYPNPVVRNQPVKISFPKPVAGLISVRNVQGQQLYQTQLKNGAETTFTLPELTPGLHVIQFESGDNRWNRKLLVY
ncbi:sialate O-acetylesterase [Dyadobacter luticola]|uniref:T9SS type A sorting domain-containing protein n=1 Tax=Dyadobacter luticola TaxID=1979387 RepID=A0A5R9L2G3_9BACT|nr:sialate O-acetylesterase [Dyadobacter luticola]TLV02611.1 T9SS type A sorting domain-containing protein [Dyadobacter luticola]